MQLFRRRANPSRKENSMKPARCFLLLCVSVVLAAQARALPLPDACGNDKIQFEVKTQKNQPAPAPPAHGMAQIAFVEKESQPGLPLTHATVRFGMDGVWVGADKGNSYFVLDVTTGTHHLCASWQGTKTFELTPFTAEAGKVYYFAAQVTLESQIFGPFVFSQLNDDEGKYRVKASKLSIAKPQPAQD
jgi:hypothetical protein